MPPAALISILQKGLQYVEAEISINEVRRYLLSLPSVRPQEIHATSLAHPLTLLDISPTGRNGLRRPADRVAVTHRRRDARRGADAAAGLPRQAGPAAGRLHHGGLHLWQPVQRAKEW